MIPLFEKEGILGRWLFFRAQCVLHYKTSESLLRQMKKPFQYHYTVEGLMVIQADIKIINEFSKEEDDICERA